MRKEILIILTICCLFSVTSCKQEDNITQKGCAPVETTVDNSRKIWEFNVYEYGINTDNVSLIVGAKHKNEVTFSYGNKVITDNSAALTYTTEIDGNLIEAIYAYSLDSMRYQEDTHIYNYIDDKYLHILGVNAETGKLTKYNKAYLKDYNEEIIHTEICSRDECENIAKTFIASVVVDSSNYSLTSERLYDDDYNVEKHNGKYTFSYSKKIGSYKVDDSISVSVTGDGEITDYSINSAGCFDNVSIIDLPSSKEVEQAVIEKCKTIFSDSYTAYDLEYKMEELLLIKKEDGQMGFICDVDVVATEYTTKDSVEDTVACIVMVSSK